MNRAMSCNRFSSRRSAHLVVGLVTAGMLALACQGTASAAGQQEASRAAAASGIDHFDWLRVVGELLPNVVGPKDNNDWQ